MLPRGYSFLSSVSVSLPFLWCDGRGRPDLSAPSPEKVLGKVVGRTSLGFRDFQVRPIGTAASSLAALLQLSFMQCLSCGGRGGIKQKRVVYREKPSVWLFSL